MKTYRQISITIRPETLANFKDFCKKHSLSLSSFLSYSGLRFIKQETGQLLQKDASPCNNVGINEPKEVGKNA